MTSHLQEWPRETLVHFEVKIWLTCIFQIFCVRLISYRINIPLSHFWEVTLRYVKSLLCYTISNLNWKNWKKLQLTFGILLISLMQKTAKHLKVYLFLCIDSHYFDRWINSNLMGLKLQLNIILTLISQFDFCS